MDDIENLTTYGFRGEALSSLCQVANLTIVSRTEAELAATRTVFREDGAVETSTSCAGMPGITVTADNLFCRLPVRRNYYKTAARRKEELDKVKRMVQAFAIVCSDVRFSVHHDKCCVWSSPGGQDMLDSVALVIGRKESKGLEKFSDFLDPATGDLLVKETELQMSGLLPVIKPGVETEMARHGKNNTWIFINRRPVEFKEAEKLLKESFMSVCGLESSKFPVCVINIIIGGNMRDNVDPNLEPNKQKVGLACKQVVIDGLTNILNRHWGLDKKMEDANEEKENISLLQSRVGEKNKSEFESDEDEPVVKEPLFNHTGFTQVNSQATSKISAANFTENSYGLSQYFGSSTKPRSNGGDEETNSNSEDKFLDGSVDDSSSSALKLQHSPVLKPEMFKDPTLPGVDAVYLNRLRDGDFPDIPDEELHDVSDREEPSDQRRNPFIQFECQEESHENNTMSESDMDLSTHNESSRSETFTTLKLKQPQFEHREKIFKSTPIKRKREDIDNSLVKIDTFLSRQKATSIKCEKMNTAPAPTENKRQKFLPRTRVNVTFNIGKCAAQDVDKIISEEDTEVIGSLLTNTDSVWAVKQGQKFFCVHPPSLREVILTERLMRHHKMPAQRLPEPVSLADGRLPPELVQTVLQLSSADDNLVTDERITLNGFLLSASVNHDSKLSKIQLLSSCNLIEDYGIDDLVGILSLINENKSISVRESRPAKVSQYLSKEAKRLARDMPSTFDKESTALQLHSWIELFGDKFESKAFHMLWPTTTQE